MMFHKIGGMVVNSTDNIILSKFVGIVSVGVYSNYYMIINGLELVTNQIFDAIVASVGNLGAKESKEKVKSVFDKVFFLNFWLFSFCAICLMCVFNNFIELWIGKEYLFELSVVVIIVIAFYLKGMRKTVLTFKDATGTFYQDRYKPIFESIINLIASIILAKKFGAAGVFLGTIISTLTTSIWVEPYVLYKYVFKEKSFTYFYKLIMYTILGICVCALTYWTCLKITYTGILAIIIKLIICLIIPNVIYIILFRKTEEFKYYKGLVDRIWKK